MPLTKQERLEVQASAATNVRYRIEEAKLRERQKKEKADFIKAENERLMNDQSARVEKAKAETQAMVEKFEAETKPEPHTEPRKTEDSSQTKKGK